MVTDTCRRGKQIFEICAVKTFLYEELKKDIDSCLQTVRGLDKGATEKQIEELKEYMKEFMHDVEEEKGCDYYEDLENLRYDKIEEIKAWLVHGRSARDGEEELEEGSRILSASEDEVPTLIGIPTTDLGKLILEKRLKSSK